MNGNEKIGIEENQIISLHHHHACFEGNLEGHIDSILEGEADVNLISKMLVLLLKNVSSE